MRKLLLSIIVIGSGFMAQSQVICAVQSPASIAGNYTFSWADPTGGWGTPNFLIPGTFVEDTLVFVNDGTTGTNITYGNLLSEEGCSPSPLNAYAGKICVIRRNTCEFGKKAFEAQEAGAVGVIIINRDPEAIAMGAGAVGANVTIPVVMITAADGAAILNQMLTDDVVAFIGNKAGLFADDAGIVPGSTLISKSYGIPALLAQNNTEFNFEIGTRIFNYGSSDQTNIGVNARVTDPSGATVYDNTVNGLNILSGDSIDIYPGDTYNFPAFSMPTYTAGRYTLTYTLALDGLTDEYTSDNSISSDFVINDSIFSYAMLDTLTNLPVANNGYRPSTNNSTYSTCMVFDNPNGSRVGTGGIYFSASTGSGSGVSLDGENFNLSLYLWEDPFTDINDVNLAFTSMLNNPIANGEYSYSGDLQGETVYGKYNSGVVLSDNQRYLACVQTFNLEVYLGHDTKTNYTWNLDTYLQPFGPIENDGVYAAAGFGADVPSAMGMSIFPAADLGIAESVTLEGVAYPNPATEGVTISLNTEGSANLTVTDVAGRVTMTKAITMINGKTEVNIASLEAGIYVFNVTLENGKTSQFNVVKK
jgi:hypothetical protein